MADKKVIFSGIQPTGKPTLGNYLGAIKHWTSMQNEYDSIFCVVDMHAITVQQDPAELMKNTFNLLALYIACRLDPDKSTLFVQSHVPAHAELTWVLNTISYVGELSRMHQFKGKSQKHKENINMALMDYPVLMASDILLYKTNLVPVGQDQKQHIEICRNLAERFNSRYGQTFVVPEVYINKLGAKIYSLANPTEKMSKSDENEFAFVSMFDEPELIVKKFKRAVTDSGSEIAASKDKPGITNLLNIYSLFTNRTVKESEKHFAGAGYGKFKVEVADTVVEALKPIQAEQKRIAGDVAYMIKVLKEGAQKASAAAAKTLEEVYKKIGFITDVNFAGVDVEVENAKCLTTPFKERSMIKPTELGDKVAQANVILCYLNLLDDVNDGAGLKKRIALMTVKRPYKKAKKLFPELDESLSDCYGQLRKLEIGKCNTFDKVCHPFAQLSASFCEIILGEKSNEYIRDLCYNLGKWVYLIDALDDLEKDFKKKNYNPFISCFGNYKNAKQFVNEHYADFQFIFYSTLNKIAENYNDLDLERYACVLKNVLHKSIRDKTERVFSNENASKQEVLARYAELKSKFSKERFEIGEKGENAAKNLDLLEIYYKDILSHFDKEENVQQFGSNFGGLEEVIRQGDLTKAQLMLDAITDRNGQWHFLQSIVFYKQNWFLESKKQLEFALALEPHNQKFKESHDRLVNIIASNKIKPEDLRTKEQSTSSGFESHPGSASPCTGNCCCDLCLAESCCQCAGCCG
ncbi:tryptophan--trna ligase mitochondrial [Holotrichia oblita]|nr:tryptophan--trna ligase mitochondrial [Holotrichia oblita]